MKRFVLTILVGAFLGAFSQHAIEDPKTKVVRDTVHVPQTPKTSSHEEAEWLARAIFSETKAEEDFEYIGWVIHNRMKSPAYPGTARRVVLQPSQFSAFNRSGRLRELRQMQFPETKVTEFRRAYRMAQYILAAPDSLNPLPEVTHFYMADTMERKYGKRHPDWAESGNLAWATQETRYYRDVRPLP